MQKRINTRLARGLFVGRDIDRLRQQRVRFRPFLSRRLAERSGRRITRWCRWPQ